MKTYRTPLRKAFDESRFILLGAVLLAIAYNVFAESRVPWVRALPGSGDTTSLEELLGQDTAATAIDTSITTIDTAAIIDSTLLVDSSALGAAERARLLEDSLRAARAAREAFVRDSIARARPSESSVDAEVANREISTATAKQIFDRKAAVWFDARNADEFAEGHIPGAKHIYANDFQQHIPELLQMNIPRDQLIVVYCGGGLCELSHDLAKNIRLLGFSKVVVYTGGTTEWTKNNYPMTKGE
ncbi:MAG TPA: rhodanese-like domain-containing protein [Candidatus Kapabacteria bacterium]|nr:rhodanese-like domain-containing protein [Candidatus Kapabacteria bacterium]